MDHINVIKKDHLLPRDYVSTDQNECRVKGILINFRGKEDPENFIMEEQCLLVMNMD